jgi:hypothetical protein
MAPQKRARVAALLTGIEVRIGKRPVIVERSLH